MHSGKPDDRVELACLKTIAAFLNTHGGSLVVGLDDEAKPVGLKHDKFDSEDKMSLHLVSLVNARMGPLAMTCTDIRFEDCEDKRIMVVKCRKASKPIFYKEKGSETEAFYVRTGPSTTQLSASQTQDYITQAWS